MLCRGAVFGDCPCSEGDFVNSNNPEVTTASCAPTASYCPARAVYETYSYTCPSEMTTGVPEYCAGQSGNTFEYKQYGGEGLAFFILAWLFELVNVVFLCVVVPRASGGGGGGGGYSDFDKQKPQASDVAGYGSQESGGYNAPGSGASGWGGQPTTVAQY